jgi:hypothetical protein
MTNYNERNIDEIITIAENAAAHLSDYCISDTECESIENGAFFDEAQVLNDLQAMISSIVKHSTQMRSSYFGS